MRESRGLGDTRRSGGEVQVVDFNLPRAVPPARHPCNVAVVKGVAVEKVRVPPGKPPPTFEPV
jgi:hypothetical protein